MLGMDGRQPDEPPEGTGDRPVDQEAQPPGEPARFPIWGWEPSRAPGSALGEPSPRRRAVRVVLAAILAAIVLLTGGIGIGWMLTRTNSTTGAGSPLRAAPAASSPATQGQGFDAQAIADKVDPAVVNINTVIDSNPFDAIPPRGKGAGTGMLVTSNGLVLTNNHVIEGATRIEVSVAGTSRTYVAQFVGADPQDDVALLQIQGASGLPTVALADSSRLSVGQAVVAIGNALGRGGAPTVTKGSISALGRSLTIDDGRGGFEHLSGMIQTDALIQPGDSGGPLVNSAGQVVGMITAGSRNGRNESGSRVGFAIPSSSALRIVNEIRAGRASSSIIVGEPGYLGVEVGALDAATARRLGLGSTAGVLVVGASPGTPAAKVGIGQGSVITAVNGQAVTSFDELGSALHRHRPGDDVRVTWVDEKGTHSATARLISGPAV